MERDPPDHAAYRFNAADLPEGERVAAWREFFAPRIFAAEIEPLADLPFQVDVAIRHMPPISTMRAFSSLARVSRSPQLIADGSQSIAIMVSSTETLAVERGREVALDTGDALIASASRPISTLTKAPAHYCGIFVSPEMLAPSCDIEAVRRVPAQLPALRYLMSYLRFVEQIPASDHAVARAMATHVGDLLSLVLGAAPDEAALAADRGLRAARLHAIRSDIARRMSSPSLSLEQVALVHGVTPRYVQRLFEMEGTTFTAYLRRCRLDKARGMLSDPRCRAWRISAIAYEAGFSDLSHFNRCFRRQFGAAPGEVREQALAGLAASVPD